MEPKKQVVEVYRDGALAGMEAVHRFLNGEVQSPLAAKAGMSLMRAHLKLCAALVKTRVLEGRLQKEERLRGSDTDSMLDPAA